MNEIQEVLDYLESLNLTTNIEKKKRSTPFKSGDLNAYERLHLRRLSFTTHHPDLSSLYPPLSNSNNNINSSSQFI